MCSPEGRPEANHQTPVLDVAAMFAWLPGYDAMLPVNTRLVCTGQP
jgi:hypothetical protein